MAKYHSFVLILLNFLRINFLQIYFHRFYILQFYYHQFNFLQLYFSLLDFLFYFLSFFIFFFLDFHYISLSNGNNFCNYSRKWLQIGNRFRNYKSVCLCSFNSVFISIYILYNLLNFFAENLFIILAAVGLILY